MPWPAGCAHNNRSRLPKHPHTAKQRLSITGLNSAYFANALAGLTHLWQLFADVVPSDSLQPWAPGQFNGMTLLEFSNRYFTLEQGRGGELGKCLDTTIDPLRILTNLCPGHLATSDNDVLYYERKEAVDG